MAMVLFYNRINWENFPSIVTPINEINLNKVDYAVKTLDERTVELYNTKAEKSVVLNTIKDWSMDEKTGIITITKVNGDVLNFDLNIEKIPVKFELSEDGILTMTTDDGSKFTADIGSMIPVIEFRGSDTITVAKYINNGIDKTYSFTVKDGSITEKKLQPNYLADIKVQAESAELSATASEESAKEAAKSAEEAKGYAEQAKEVIFPVSDVALNRQTLGYTKKNLLKFNSKSGTSNGITYNSDGESGIITINGTATSMFYLTSIYEPLYLKAGDYIFSGCPVGGRADDTFYYRHSLSVRYPDGTTTGDWNDYGDGIKVTVTQEQVDKGVYFSYFVVVWTGFVANNLTFYPMVRSADIKDDAFEPYVDDIDTRLKALTPVNNLLATVPGSPLDAVIGKMLNDMIVALKDSFVVYPVSLINGWNGALFVSINKINRQATITGYIDGTNATSVTFAKGRTYVSQLEPTLSYMPIPVQGTAYTAIDFNTELHRITFSAGNDGIWDVKVPSTGKIYQFNASVIVAYD